MDPNPASPNYGTMIISYALSSGAQQVTRSTDGGATWSTPVGLVLPAGVTFMRNVQDTGGPDGTFFIAGMNENGGGLAARTNYMYRSTDGGVTWSSAIALGS